LEWKNCVLHENIFGQKWLTDQNGACVVKTKKNIFDQQTPKNQRTVQAIL
jgi:hypothetical protein